MAPLADPPTLHHTSTPGARPPGRVVLSERAKSRLRIAAGFLRKRGQHFAGDDFYQEVLNSLESMQEAEKQVLKGLVDWVEGYQLGEDTSSL